eukprot:5051222-Prymnesium_polylepis.1
MERSEARHTAKGATSQRAVIEADRTIGAPIARSKFTAARWACLTLPSNTVCPSRARRVQE